MAPPRLRVVESSAPQRWADGQGTFALDAPLSRVKGIGPKLAERLASLGLLLVRDLLLYYPRDYVDYSAMRRIEALEPGTTATIVATVRRCHGFTSPRNPNLSILELQVQDPTGRLKGRVSCRQTLQQPSGTAHPDPPISSGCHRGHQWSEIRPHGLSFQDPLIEVLESSCPVRSPDREIAPRVCTH